MKKTIYTLIALLLSTSIFLSTKQVSAQAPQSFKYQAVVRDGSGEIIADQQVGLRIWILQGSTSGAAAYIETHAPTTNGFGLINLEIGNGTVVSGDFSAIDWGSDSYFLRIEIDISGGTSYTEMGTSQLLSVPYALYAKTAETISGTVTETDPVFDASVASGITATDTTNWNNKLDSFTETDPVFGASVAGGITGTDTANWNNKLDSYTETDPNFTAHPSSNILESDILNWETAYNWGNHSVAGYLTNDSTFKGLVRSTEPGNSFFTGGNVGIGTADPFEKLHVNGNIKLDDSLHIGSDCSLFSNATDLIKTNNSFQASRIGINNEPNPTWEVYVAGQAYVSDNLRTDGYLMVGDDEYFYRDAEDRIKTSDNFEASRIGINHDPSSTWELYVTGDIYASAMLRADGGLYAGDDEYFYRGAEDFIKTDDTFGAFRIGIGKSPGEKLDISEGNGRVDVGYNWLTNSDMRYKKNVTTLLNSLNKVKNLRGVRFDLEDDSDIINGQGKYIGFIAQELENEFPELVMTDEEGYKSVAYDKMTAILVEAIKEQQKIIEELIQEIDQIKNK